MPITWDPNMDRKLFLAILETSNVTIDYEKVAAILNTPEQPCTKVAVMKRFTKIKAEAKLGGTGNDGGDGATPKTKAGKGKRAAEQNADGESRTKKGKGEKGKGGKVAAGALGGGSDDEEIVVVVKKDEMDA